MHKIQIKTIGNSNLIPEPVLVGNRIKLHYANDIDSKIILSPRKRVAVPTGISIELPGNIEAVVVPSQTLANETGITVLNSPGTIDPDYRGEIMVILINLGEEDVAIETGGHIADLRIQKFSRVNIVEAEDLTPTSRQERGLGSTGT